MEKRTDLHALGPSSSRLSQGPVGAFHELSPVGDFCIDGFWCGEHGCLLLSRVFLLTLEKVWEDTRTRIGNDA
jgi:hypothetical protein